MSVRPGREHELFTNLVVLELANQRCERLDRALRIVQAHSTIVRYNNVRAAIKFRDVDRSFDSLVYAVPA